MRVTMATKLVLAASLLVGLCATHWAFGNGGPFVVKYPSGDPAAKGVLARLDPSLKPAQETRLRVVKEDLTVSFGAERFSGNGTPPLANVTAAYTIENPTGEEVQVDFGFPILRGIYMNPFSMMPTPDVRVMIDKEYASATIISNSAIYGLIRQNARGTIEKGITGNVELASLTAAVRAAWVAPRPAVPNPQPAAQKAVPPAPAKQTGKSNKENIFTADLDIPFTAVGVSAPAPPVSKPAERKPTADYLPARENLRKYLTGKRQWNDRDAALLVEYASLEFVANANWLRVGPRDRWDHYGSWRPNEVDKLKNANLGALAAIGEQKATQLFAQLASRFDKEAAGTYEAIFAAWGGNVRERSIDMQTGELRPREVTLPTLTAAYNRRLTSDPTVYARVDYLDPNAKLTAEEKASCQAILKNLPVVFTFAPMNLLHYQAKFPAKATRLVTVSYSQYAADDTRGSGSYQLAYVLHPATLWKEFGPINLAVHVPTGIACKASAEIQKIGAVPPPAPGTPPPGTWPMELYQATLAKPAEKSGELFLAVDKAAWDKMFPPAKPSPTPPVVTGPPGTGLHKSSTGTFILNGAGTYAGPTTVEGGTLQLDAVREPQVQEVAASYFEALVTGDVEKADRLSAVPFYFDGKETLKTMEQIKEKHQAILKDKGKRAVPKYTKKTLAEASPLDSNVFPKHQTVRITIGDKGEHIDVYVMEGDTRKVIGFRD